MRIFESLRKQKLLSISMTLVTLAAGIVIGTLLTTGVSAARGQGGAPDAAPIVIPPVSKLQNEFVTIAKTLEPSVVFISTDYQPKQPQITQRRRPAPQQSDDEADEAPDMFQRFFGSPSPNGGDMRRYRQQGSGSGFIVDKNGYIVTNLHVVDNADTIKVKMHGDEREYKAKVIGSDIETDIAVIKIDAGRPLPAVKVANSDGVQVGDWAIAIGAPFGLEASVTAGIVSAMSRDIARQFQPFIQTDAAINPGNSGGPLVNIKGEVIGVNTMIATSSGGYQGIGFALPSNLFARVYNQIIETGRVSRGSIGIRFDKVTKQETLKALGFNNGVIIGGVQQGGPADKAGLKAEDILLSLNGKPVKDGDDLVARVSSMPAGSEITVTLDRAGQKLDKKVTIADREETFKDDPQFARNRPEMVDPDAKGQNTAKFGVGIRAMTAEQRKELQFNEPGGVVVTAVEEGSFADEIGLRERDIITSINRQPVSSFEDVKAVQAKLKPGDPVAFRVMRPIPGRRGEVQWAGSYLSGSLPEK